ncbi:MAG: hypothetical protein ACKPKO_24465, partial [Candidatus Fonsibacter sp.]
MDKLKANIKTKGNLSLQMSDDVNMEQSQDGITEEANKNHYRQGQDKINASIALLQQYLFEPIYTEPTQF